MQLNSCLILQFVHRLMADCVFCLCFDEGQVEQIYLVFLADNSCTVLLKMRPMGAGRGNEVES